MTSPDLSCLLLASESYFNPTVDGAATGVNPSVWGSVDVLFEVSMRCLFSTLFGAGVVLLTTGSQAKGGRLHYRRNFWLLMFGLLDIYLLLWLGDILVTYAIAGAILFPLRNKSPRWLLTAAFCAGNLDFPASVQFLVAKSLQIRPG